MTPRMAMAALRAGLGQLRQNGDGSWSAGPGVRWVWDDDGGRWSLA